MHNTGLSRVSVYACISCYLASLSSYFAGQQLSLNDNDVKVPPIKQEPREGQESNDDDAQSSSSGTSSSSGDKKKKESMRKHKDQQAKARKEVKSASRMKARLAPVISQLRSHKSRITSGIRSRLPPYQIMDVEHHLLALSELETLLEHVVQGNTSMAREELLNDDDMNRKINQAKVAATAFATTLQGIEVVVAAAKRSLNEGHEEKKEKKKKKKAKKA